MKYTHLTREERHTISTMTRKGDSPAIIASALGRDRSTISRELKRNVFSFLLRARSPESEIDAMMVRK